MLRLVLLCLALLGGSRLSSARCPSSDWRQSGGMCYARSQIQLAWSEHRAVCGTAHQGADIASVHDFELNAFITEELGAGWLGLRRTSTGANWVWADGSPANFTNWQSGQPDRDTDACVVLGANNRWYDDPCDASHYFICQTDALPDDL